MKFASIFIILAMTSALLIAPLALAEDSAMRRAADSGETIAQGQPFMHPDDDSSYYQNMRDDERLATGTPTPGNNGNVQYISGGIADSGMRAIDAEESSYNLKILFASNGEYLANVRVDIVDKKGNPVLDTVAKGPVLLVKMQPGHYTVNTKTERGMALKRHVQVHGDHLASYVFRYPADGQ